VVKVSRVVCAVCVTDAPELALVVQWWINGTEGGEMGWDRMGWMV